MPRVPTAIALATAAGCLVLAAGGCGGGGGSTVVTKSAYQKAEERAEAEAPKRASPALRAIYRSFPPPKPDPKVKNSGKAIKAGEHSCKGKTPLEVKEEFIGESKLLPEQEKMVAKLAHYEASSQSADFVAGQLAALVYEGTVSNKALANYGYRGCVYSLARGLEQKLAPR